jgi:hypothetical protein
MVSAGDTSEFMLQEAASPVIETAVHPDTELPFNVKATFPLGGTGLNATPLRVAVKFTGVPTATVLDGDAEMVKVGCRAVMV